MAAGGWTRILRRHNGAVNFDLLWNDYKEGFGDLTGEHWIGNDVIHQLTNGEVHQLQVDITLFDGSYMYAKYDSFKIDSENASYSLSVSGYSGSAVDGLAYHNSYAFASKDKDHRNCASQYTGGWWYNNCHTSNLNAMYWYGGSCNQTSKSKCICWSLDFCVTGGNYKEITMKIQGNVPLFDTVCLSISFPSFDSFASTCGLEYTAFPFWG